ncbi:MAG: TonB-dependent receptor, partial [Alphaproteobacteria bacterium]|nr:TonB-dependent receptor [Alphaproteobacteria bacterium]
LASRRSLFDSRSQNHELQFISPLKQWLNGKFDMVAGLYYFAEDFGLGEKLNMGTSYCNVLVPAGAGRTACNAYLTSTGGVAATNQNVFQNVKSFAAYSQGNVHLTDQLTLTLGGRWTNDKKSGTFAQASSPFTQALRATEALTFPSIDESRFTYRVSLNYKPTKDVLLFANYSTGYKSGGYNSGGGSPALTVVGGVSQPDRRVFAPETVQNYELGIKSSWLDRKLKLNLTLYRMDIAGFQDRAFDGVSFIVRNAGSLRQQGFEFDTVIAPVRNFSLTGSLAYLDSKFTDYANGAGLPGCAPVGGVIPAVCANLPFQGQQQNLTGQPNTFSPKWSGNVAADWSGNFGSGGLGWALNANVSFVSSQYVGTSLDANPQTLASGYALLGARATIHGKDDRWSFSVFALNLTDENYSPLAVNQPLAGPLGLNNGVFAGSTAIRIQVSEPRTWGASASFRF